jgi:hypothetical protein
MSDTGRFRVGSHSKVVIWDDPVQGEKTGTPVGMALTPYWARRIADALNAAEPDRPGDDTGESGRTVADECR